MLDWDLRIAAYPPSLKAKYKRGLELKDKFFSRLAEPQSNGWSVFIDNKKKNLFAEMKTSENGLPMFRARTTSNHDALTTFRYAGSCETRPYYDKNTDYAKCINKLGVNYLVGYQRTLRVFTVAPRDLYIEGIFNMEEDGRCWSLAFDAPDEYPVEDGIVRMRSPMAALLFTPCKDDPKKCIIETVVEAEIGGNIPNWIFKHVLGDTANGIVLMRELLPEWVKPRK